MNGKYVALLEELSSRNDFFKNYYELIQVARDISPASYVMVIHNYHEIDFSKEEERLIVIINLLRASGPIVIN
ncbi:MAG: hypothetical protein ACERKD_00790 [Prolixibacteraceae bacterium]